MSFNPRTRVGCEVILVCVLSENLFQSTHPCGVRMSKMCADTCHLCFNPRTRVGCELIWFIANSRITSFNPRTRVGCEGYTGFKRFFVKVSIHAPVWGAKTVKHQDLIICGFNPRTRVGCEDYYQRECGIALFQSTHPCGVRIDMVYR